MKSIQSWTCAALIIAVPLLGTAIAQDNSARPGSMTGPGYGCMQFMIAQLDAMRAVNKAFEPLYAALTETQKQSADQLFWGPMDMM